MKPKPNVPRELENIVQVYLYRRGEYEKHQKLVMEAQERLIKAKAEFEDAEHAYKQKVLEVTAQITAQNHKEERVYDRT